MERSEQQSKAGAEHSKFQRLEIVEAEISNDWKSRRDLSSMRGVKICEIEQNFSVSYAYPFVFTRGLFSAQNPVLAETVMRRGESRRHRIAVVIDEAVAAVLKRIKT